MCLMKPSLNPTDERVLKMLAEGNHYQIRALEGSSWQLRSGGSRQLGNYPHYSQE